MTRHLKPNSINYIRKRKMNFVKFLKIQLMYVFHFALKMSVKSLFKEEHGEKTQHFKTPLRTTLWKWQVSDQSDKVLEILKEKVPNISGE